MNTHNTSLRERGLPSDVTESGMEEVDTTSEKAIILNDGNY